MTLKILIGILLNTNNFLAWLTKVDEKIFVRRAQEICSHFNVNISFFGDMVSYRNLTKWTQSPFDEHIAIKTKQLVAELLVSTHVDSLCPKHISRILNARLCGIIHELGHICIAGSISDDIDESDFFAWEFAVAKKFDLEKFHEIWMHDYGIELDNRVFDNRFPNRGIVHYGMLEEDEEAFIMKKLSQKAVQLGYIVEGEPIRVKKHFDRELK